MPWIRRTGDGDAEDCSRLAIEMSLLRVDHLNVRFATPDGEVQAVKDLSFQIEAGETLGVVGESGSGKSQSMLAMLGLLAENGSASGRAVFGGEDLLRLPAEGLRRIRGKRISMIFQDPMTSLNPYLTIAEQMMQVLRAHGRVSKQTARRRCLQMLDAVKIPEAAARLDRYPHELSGGMRQRVMIAASLLLRPELLIADEPTTALDVTVQAQILKLLTELQAELGTAIVLITHDLGVVAGMADRVLVMHDGGLCEQGTADEIFHRPRQAYTRALLEAVPRLDAPLPERTGRLAVETRDGLLRVEGLRVEYPVDCGGWLGKRRMLSAVDGVDFELGPGEVLGVVGESGCGKSTLAKAILRLVPASAGRVGWLGRDLAALKRNDLRRVRRDLQVVFQDPLASLNPRMTVGDIVAEPLWTHRPELTTAAARARVREVLQKVGLSGRELNRYPHEFSGGQCQRIGIARALVLEPKLIVCDEPVSALDVSIRAQVIELLMSLRDKFGIALIFIAHDLAVVRRISDRVMVMYLGAIVEIAPARTLYAEPSHPYTQALISAVPIPDPDIERLRRKELLAGDLPSPLDPPSGCRFRSRCRHAEPACGEERPALRRVAGGLVACRRAEQLKNPVAAGPGGP